MASLQEIKKRLSSVAVTKKITKAMELVATAKLRRAKKNLTLIKEYSSVINDAFSSLVKNSKNIEQINPKPKKDNVLYVVITSDLGLCGSYNANIFKALENVKKPKDEIIILGSKGIAFLNSKNIEPVLNFSSINHEITYEIASKSAKYAISKYTTGEIAKIKLIHTEFINSVTFEAKVDQILPIVDKETDVSQKSSSIEYEPSPEEVLKSFQPLYVSSIINHAIVESKLSEMSSRRTAMESATDNADELISNLGLEYNRARQASITQEITEIVAGGE